MTALHRHMLLRCSPKQHQPQQQITNWILCKQNAKKSGELRPITHIAGTVSSNANIGIPCHHTKPGNNLEDDRYHSSHPCSTIPNHSATMVNTSNKRYFSTSVSKDEVSKFSALASTWYDSSSNPLIGMNPIRLSYIQQILQQRQLSSSEKKEEDNYKSPLNGLRALDVGCGGGLLSISLANLGANVTAVDPSAEIVKVAQEYFGASKKSPNCGSIDFRGGTSVETLSQEISENKQELFDVVCILEVIEHTSNPKSLLSAASSLLKPNGILFISTVNKTLKSYGLAILGAEYITRKVPVGTHSYGLFKSPETVKSVMESVGMKEMDKCGMVVEVTPFMWKDLRWKLDKNDLDVNWIGAYVHDVEK